MGGTESMQDIGPDMDDLLRRAADGYPLREPADDWDKIASQLSDSQVAPVVPEKPQKRRRFLWLLLLLLPLAGWYYLQSSSSESTTVAQDEIVQTGDNKAQAAMPADHSSQTDQLAASSEAVSTVSDKEIAPNSSIVPQSSDSESISNAPASDVSNKGNDNSIAHSKDHTGITTRNSSPIPLAIVHKEQVSRPNNGFNETLLNSQQEWFNAGRNLYGVDAVSEEFSTSQLNKTPASISPVPAIQLASFDSSDALQKSGTTTGNKRRFYYGALAGIGFSSVKNYGLKRAGYDFGLFAGYRFYNNLSVEAGVFAAHKYYMSRGDDFNTSGLGNMMQPGVKMMEVDGSSQVIAIPLHVKFDIPVKKNNRVYLKTGVSSIIMTKESNNYYTMNNGNPEMLKGIYTKNKNYLAASIDLAAGYEMQLKGNLFLRIEPYVQIPIRHIGVGAIPVTSAGLHLGISWPAK